MAEILIAMVILAIAAAGIFASFIAANRFTSRAKRRIAAVNLARHIGEKLYTEVRADTWTEPADNLLACTTYPCSKVITSELPALSSDNPLRGYNPSATLDIALDDADPVNSPRIATIRIGWTE